VAIGDQERRQRHLAARLAALQRQGDDTQPVNMDTLWEQQDPPRPAGKF